MLHRRHDYSDLHAQNIDLQLTLFSMLMPAHMASVIHQNNLSVVCARISLLATSVKGDICARHKAWAGTARLATTSLCHM